MGIGYGISDSGGLRLGYRLLDVKANERDWATTQG